MKFRPCIDLHDGQVKQIVGGSLNDSGQNPATNFVSSKPSSWYANLYREDNLLGGHVIKLGANNDQPAKEALAAWPGGLQIGGGITAENASGWMQAGAAKIIVTSYVFSEGRVDFSRLEKLVSEVGKENLVLDLSCRQKQGQYFVVTDRWQTFTDTAVDADSLAQLSDYCSEFLIHGVDVEGLQQGMDETLIALLAENVSIPCVYAGGVRSFEDLQKLKAAGNGKIDVTVGSALDLFGGKLPYRRVVDFCNS
ncbi:phosphoribosylformimino-5-aminoimidazole carboxamide ribotide isomerase [Reinekea marinisedimentorum]|uniref:Phosphoribosylformimino-5-aminoimidazole carboxamide ribotide isomerase n=1 Tax=Reinekea marinisedimentorum TaxID=230495 RepID=A0A4R3I572_9GAMM|nr:phosphoribosylformimino-5-aminoimidazole carboxamide ribotide isomerase [Reinekea marinisedimentorum]TCS40791.1 phosphoribosylformimino-5-aminoimidazole carboxamide ribotide isomerase [Reinekea marinisedimentorum]